MADTSELAGRTASVASDGRLKRAYAIAKAYFLLTKPRVIELLLVTTVPAMILAAGELPALDLIAYVLIGGALAAGGANTINCWIERDRDQVMGRTRNRPLPTGAVSPDAALVFGLRARSRRVRAALGNGEPAVGVTRGRRHAVLRLRVHDLAEAA